MLDLVQYLKYLYYFLYQDKKESKKTRYKYWFILKI